MVICRALPPLGQRDQDMKDMTIIQESWAPSGLVAVVRLQGRCFRVSVPFMMRDLAVAVDERVICEVWAPAERWSEVITRSLFCGHDLGEAGRGGPLSCPWEEGLHQRRHLWLRQGGYVRQREEFDDFQEKTWKVVHSVLGMACEVVFWGEKACGDSEGGEA